MAIVSGQLLVRPQNQVGEVGKGHRSLCLYDTVASALVSVTVGRLYMSNWGKGKLRYLTTSLILSEYRQNFKLRVPKIPSVEFIILSLETSHNTAQCKRRTLNVVFLSARLEVGTWALENNQQAPSA